MGWLNLILWLVGTLVLVLGPIIIIHELGHFLAAKLAGVRVEEFGLGFPPRMLKLWREKGYVRIGTTRCAILKRSKLPFNPVTGAWVEATLTRKNDGGLALREMRVVAPDENPAIEPDTTQDSMRVIGELAEYEPGTLYSLNWLPMGAYVRMTGEEDPSDSRSLASKPKLHRIAVLAAGPVINLVAALVILTGAYASGLPTNWQVRIASVVADSAAEHAGLLPGDLIMEANGIRITESTEQLRNIVMALPEQELSLTVQRGNEQLRITASPDRGDDGNGLLGIVMDSWPSRGGLEYYSLSKAFSSSLRDIGSTVVAMIRLPAMLIRGQVSPQEARPSSIVGISGMLTFALQRSFAWHLPFPALQTAAIISLAIGLTNLLPLPALDGGRILFVIIEAIRGRRIAPEREAAVNFIVLVLLMGLMVVLMFQDIINPIIPWSWLR